MQSTIRTQPYKPNSNSKDACLVFIHPPGPDMGRRYTLDQRPAVLGRDSECQICVLDSAVSRRHVTFTLGPEGYYALDMDSTNGTYINDHAISRALLQDGDYLRIGSSIFRFLSGGNVEAEYHQVIYEMTILDALTETHNKKYLLEFLERELVRSVRYQRPLSVVMLDIDHFKTINDNYGHLCGDYALREMASRIKTTIRRDELFARYGGEEFAVVLPEADTAGAVPFAERLRTLVAEKPFQFDNQTFPVTISLGVGTTDGKAECTPIQILDLADKNLYQAKNQGRNCVVS